MVIINFYTNKEKHTTLISQKCNSLMTFPSSYLSHIFHTPKTKKNIIGLMTIVSSCSVFFLPFFSTSSSPLNMQQFFFKFVVMLTSYIFSALIYTMYQKMDPN